MDLKSNDYNIVKSEIPINEIFFNIFIVPKDSYEKYSKWEDIDNKVEVQELTKFTVNEHNYFFPLNRDYSKWGLSISESKNLSTVSVKFKDIPSPPPPRGGGGRN